MLGGSRAESEKGGHGATRDRHAETLGDKPLSHGDAQINSNELN